MTLTHSSGLVRSIILARLLSPDDYGLFALAATVMSALSALTDLRLDGSVIANKFENDKELHDYLNTIWTVGIVRRFCLSALVFILAYPAARFYGDDRLYLILLSICLTPFIQSFHNIGLVLLRKKVNFKRVVYFEQTTNFVSMAVVILLGWLTRNVWAFVISLLVSTLLSVLLSYVFHPFRPRLAFKREAFNRSLSFGKHMFVISLMTYVVTTVDNIVVGKLLGASVLGAYVIAYNLARLPVLILNGVISNVTFPAYAELASGNSQRLENAFAKVFTLSTTLLTLITVPIMLLAEDITAILYGSKWKAAAPLLPIMALIGIFRGLANLTSPLVMGLNRPGNDAKAKVIEGVLFLSLIYPLTARYGTVGAAWAGVIVYFITFLIRFEFARRILPNVSRRLQWVLVNALVAAAMGWLAGMLLISFIETGWVRLLAGASVSICVTGLLMLMMRSDLRQAVSNASNILRSKETPSEI